MLGGSDGEKEKGRSEQAAVWVSLGVSTQGYSQPSV